MPEKLLERRYVEQFDGTTLDLDQTFLLKARKEPAHGLELQPEITADFLARNCLTAVMSVTDAVHADDVAEHVIARHLLSGAIKRGAFSPSHAEGHELAPNVGGNLAASNEGAYRRLEAT
jgi:hypothetical protein